jgi:hypothetical protein
VGRTTRPSTSWAPPSDPPHARVALHLHDFVGTSGSGHLATTGLVGIWHQLGATLAVLSERVTEAAKTLGASDQTNADASLAATGYIYSGAGTPAPQTLPGGQPAIRKQETDFVERVLRGQA